MLQDVSEEKGRAGNNNAGQKIGGLLDPEDRLNAQQHVTDGAATNARHAAEQGKADNIHLFARGDQGARYREHTETEPIQGCYEILQHVALGNWCCRRGLNSRPLPYQ